MLYIYYCLSKGVNDYRFFTNYGLLLRDLGKFERAENFLRKAIEIKPDISSTYSNLAVILRNLGKLEEAENFLRKAITLNPNFARAYYSLSTLKISTEDFSFYKYLFSKDILNKKNDEEKIDIFFARANILHIQKKLSSF